MIKEIIIHCSATPAGRDVTAAEIDQWHRARGFRCIGYHYVIRLDGTIEKGRREGEVGAHCLGHNGISIGICYVGGLSKTGNLHADTRTPAQKESLRRLVRELRGRYRGVTVHGHREFANKACPCFDVSEL